MKYLFFQCIHAKAMLIAMTKATVDIQVGALVCADVNAYPIIITKKIAHFLDVSVNQCKQQ